MDKKTYSVIVLEDNPSLEIKRGDILKLFTNDEYKVLYENISLPIISSDLNIDLDTWCDMIKVRILPVDIGDTVLVLEDESCYNVAACDILVPGILGVVDEIFIDNTIKCKIHKYLYTARSDKSVFTVPIDRLTKGVWTEND